MIKRMAVIGVVLAAMPLMISAQGMQGGGRMERGHLAQGHSEGGRRGR